MILNDKNWNALQYRRRLETFGSDDNPGMGHSYEDRNMLISLVIATGPNGEFDAVCQPGELTDRGRETTLALGRRLRHLYVDQLHFMPELIADADMIYLRATPIPRALQSLQQAFWGFYPPSARTADFPPPTIVQRQAADETLFPNDASCRRFAQLSRAFAQRAADKWNDTEDMQYLSKVLSKWMPNQAKVAVDSKPRLSGIMDTLNATDAHGPATKLPKEFYDPKARAIIDKIAVEEWFQGYNESAEYRMLGIGALMGDITARMTGSIERNGGDGLVEVGESNGKSGQGRGGEKNIKFAMSGCHDTTLAGVLASLGAFDGEKWPPFTSHIAIELFRKSNASAVREVPSLPEQPPSSQPKSWWSSLFGSTKSFQASDQVPKGIGRKPLGELTQAQKGSLADHFVRIRYNDKVMQVPGCKAEGKHLPGDTTFCTLVRPILCISAQPISRVQANSPDQEAFKSIVDKYTPKDWQSQCRARLDQPCFPDTPQPSGYA